MSQGDADGNRYFETVNFGQEIEPVGAGTLAGASALDENVAVYSSFANGKGAAFPYDGYLVRQYSGTYPLKNIAELDPQFDASGSASSPIAGSQESASSLIVKPFQSTGATSVLDMAGSSQGGQAASATLLTEHLVSHYGDWPSPELIVVNVGSA